MTSVMVVKMIFTLCARSKPIRFIIRGITASDNPAKNKLTSIPKPITSPKKGSPTQTQASGNKNGRCDDKNRGCEDTQLFQPNCDKDDEPITETLR